MKKLIVFIFLLLPVFAFAEGPILQNPDTTTQLEFDNAYSDLRNVKNLPGRILQALQFTSTTSSSTSSTIFVPTGLTGTITPTSSKNIILVAAFSNFQAGQVGFSSRATIERNNSNLLSATGQADTQDTNRSPASLGYIDSPASTSALTYTIYFMSANGTSCTWGASGTQVLWLLEIGQ